MNKQPLHENCGHTNLLDNALCVFSSMGTCIFTLSESNNVTLERVLTKIITRNYVYRHAMTFISLYPLYLE